MDMSQHVKDCLEAEQKGIPVAWKEVALRLHDAAVQVVKELQAESAQEQ